MKMKIYDKIFHGNVKLILVWAIIGVIHATFEVLSNFDVIEHGDFIKFTSIIIFIIHILAFMSAIILFKGQWHKHKKVC